MWNFISSLVFLSVMVPLYPLSTRAWSRAVRAFFGWCSALQILMMKLFVAFTVRSVMVHLLVVFFVGAFFLTGFCFFSLTGNRTLLLRTPLLFRGARGARGGRCFFA